MGLEKAFVCATCHTVVVRKRSARQRIFRTTSILWCDSNNVWLAWESKELIVSWRAGVGVIHAAGLAQYSLCMYWWSVSSILRNPSAAAGMRDAWKRLDMFPRDPVL